MILVTGGAGFIGSNFILEWLKTSDEAIINLDALTYAGNLQNLSTLLKDSRYVFVHGDIADRKLILEILFNYQPRAIINFAAESHVDRSIKGPETFIQTNIVGTFQLLEATREYWSECNAEVKKVFRFLHVSTDEVYGSLANDESAFAESHAYNPSSPYAASKASSDHLVKAYNLTYNIPTLTTSCSNNYGPHHFPEKLIPLSIVNALEGKPLPIYGDGMQIRDWLYVIDHCDALRQVLARGRVGESYNIGGNNEKTNLEVVNTLCNTLDEMSPRSDGLSYTNQIKFVSDRPGHDRRYAINASKIRSELGWHPSNSFENGIKKTVRWYLENMQWVHNVTSGEYRDWIVNHYGETV